MRLVDTARHRGNLSKVAMIRRETTSDLPNRIANDPSVRPWLMDNPVDLSPALWGGRSEGERVFVLSNGEDAVGLCEFHRPGVYRVHTLFGPTCRGKKAVETGKEMVQWMFEHGAEVLWGATPLNNHKARWFNRQVGGRVLFDDGKVEYFEMRKH